MFHSIRNRLMFYFLLTVIIPVATMFVFNVVVFEGYYQEKLFDSYNEKNIEKARSLELYLDNVIRLTEIPASDAEIYDYLKQDFRQEKNAYSTILEYRLISEGLLQRIITYGEGINDVILYKQAEQKVYSKTTESVELFSSYRPQEEPWYDLVTEAQGKAVVYFDDNRQQVIISRSIQEPFEKESLGVLVIRLNRDYISRLIGSQAVSWDRTEILLDGSQQVFYSNNGKLTVTDDDIEGILEAEESVSSIDNTVYISAVTEGSVGEWTLVSLMPEALLFEEIDDMRNTMMIVVAVLILFLMIIVGFQTNSITGPIIRLSHKMVNVDEEAIEVVDEVEGKDEIAFLHQAFNEMKSRIQGLLTEVKSKEKQKREAELYALQNQIGPHFLYNTLGSIQFVAKMHGQNVVYDALDDLIWIFDVSMKTIDEFVDLGMEMELIRRNIRILNLRYMKDVQTDLVLEESIEGAYIPKFILQPFVENAFIHGFEAVEAPCIRVHCCAEGEDLICTVADNGIGMPDETLESFSRSKKMKESINSIGIQNVIQRIDMLFGESYGVTVENDQGTTIRIRLPLRRTL